MTTTNPPSSAGLGGDSEAKPLARSARKSSNNMAQLTSCYRQPAFHSAVLSQSPKLFLSKSASMDRALGAVAKHHALKKRPASVRHSIFVTSSAWQSPVPNEDAPPLRPRRPSCEDDASSVLSDAEDDAPPSMPQRQASVQDCAKAVKVAHAMMMSGMTNSVGAGNANMPTRKASVYDCANIHANYSATGGGAGDGAGIGLVMPTRKASVQNTLDAIYPTRKASVQSAAVAMESDSYDASQQPTNNYCSGLSNQRNFVFGETPAKPLRHSSFFDTLRTTEPVKMGGSGKHDKAPASYQRKVSVSEIGNFARISLQSQKNLHCMSTSPNSVLPKQTAEVPPTPASTTSPQESSSSPSVHDAQETWACIQRDFYALVACQQCHTELTCIRNVAHVQCPQCHSLTTNPNGSDGTETIGIGLTLQDLRRLEGQSNATALQQPQASATTGNA